MINLEINIFTKSLAIFIILIKFKTIVKIIILSITFKRCVHTLIEYKY